MKLQMVGSHTPPKGNAMPEDCIKCHNAEWGTIVVDSVCVKCMVEELAALREAGEKMAEMLKPFAYAFNKVDNDPFHKKGEGMTVPYSVVDLSLKTKMADWKNISAALAEWEAANK